MRQSIGSRPFPLRSLRTICFVAVAAFCAAPAWSQTATGNVSIVLVPAGSAWRYVDNGTVLPPDWTTLDFNDRNWPEGPAQLGYGDGDEATLLTFGPDSGNKVITTFFRRTFVATNALAFDQLLVDVIFDDGAVGYLNGTELFRLNMPAGPITRSTLAVTNRSGTQENRFSRMTVSALPSTGTNVLAVEVHQSTSTGPDLSFDLRLVATNSTQLIRGPYLQTGSSTGAVIRWRTAVPNPTWVLYGTNEAALDRIHDLPALTTEHVARLTSLAPETRYYYQIGNGHSRLKPKPDSFRTDSPRVRPVRIWAIGDSGTQSPSQRAVRDAYLNEAASRETDVWLMLGDNAYGSGLDDEYQGAVFNTYQDLLVRTFLWPTIGNHDSYAGPTIDQFPYLDIFTLPSLGEAGGVPSGTEKYYSFNHANIHFVCLDSMTSDRSDSGPMITWLQADLQQNDKSWVIAYWHHPPYSAGSHTSDFELELVEMRENIVPLLETFGTDLVLSGHSHCYERSYLLHGHYGHSGTLTPGMLQDAGDGRVTGTGAYTKRLDGPEPSLGTVFVVGGSSGQISGGPLNHPAMHVSLNQLGSIIIDIDGMRLDARFLRETGVIEDAFTILKTEGAEPVRIVAFEYGAETSRIQWKSVAGLSYQVEAADDLNRPVWERVGAPMVASGATSTWLVPNSPAAQARYYRILELPQP